jgi:hypothetical protein
MTGIATPPSLFVVACPACSGWSAADVAQAGAAVCCPLCAAAFLVPHPASAPSTAPPVHAAPEPATEIQFRDPLKTVGRGPNTIELRRLTPEEKDARRRRRNIVMLLTGAAILIAIAVVFGSGPRRR